ncbi:CLUMA_CG016626, isoform A [Clunio marinus]|uniref:CLUMA_CG016626, isoform A n=1 Tax=Clunio marinus TaxID=568069 RepID=A0A1J1IS83_9DIPT|nr:CLUMA_CG016626, isoform A [Clunio marinus]
MREAIKDSISLDNKSIATLLLQKVNKTENKIELIMFYTLTIFIRSRSGSKFPSVRILAFKKLVRNKKNCQNKSQH